MWREFSYEFSKFFRCKIRLEKNLNIFSFKKIENIDPVLEKNLRNLNRQFLHAKTLGFIHPTKNKEMIFNSILPQELEILLKTLRNTEK